MVFKNLKWSIKEFERDFVQKDMVAKFVYNPSKPLLAVAFTHPQKNISFSYPKVTRYRSLIQI